MRDFPYWRHSDVKKKTSEVLNIAQEGLKAKDPNAKVPPIAGLVVSIYKPSLTVKAGRGERDLVY